MNSKIETIPALAENALVLLGHAMPAIANPSRAVEELQACAAMECRVSLAMQKRRALRALHGIPSAGERIQGKALGSKGKAIADTYARATRASLQDAESPHLGKVAATIVKRLNYPKAKQGKKLPPFKGDIELPSKQATKATRESNESAKLRRLLSPDEECEVFQTCALVLVARNALHAETLTFEDWKALFRACRDSLSIDRMRGSESATDPESEVFSLLEAAAGIDGEAVAIARQRLAKRFRYWHACLRKSLETSVNRQRKANFKLQLATLRKFATGTFRLRGMNQLELQAASKAQARLFKSISRGEKAFDLEAESEACERKPAAWQALAQAMQETLA